MIKICPKCDKEKHHSDFCKNKSTADGYNSWCKECCNAYAKWYRVKNLVAKPKRVKKSYWFYRAAFEEDQELLIKKYCAKKDMEYSKFLRKAVHNFFEESC